MARAVEREPGMSISRATPPALRFGATALLMLAAQSCVAEEGPIDTKEGTIKVETVAQGLETPWGAVFLPDGRMLVTERPGRLRIVAKDGTLSEPLGGRAEGVRARSRRAARRDARSGVRHK